MITVLSHFFIKDRDRMEDGSVRLSTDVKKEEPKPEEELQEETAPLGEAEEIILNQDDTEEVEPAEDPDRKSVV